MGSGEYKDTVPLFKTKGKRIVFNKQVKELIDFCGLPWQEKCLHVEKNEAPVSTASKVQVREPINSKSIGRWKNYAKQSSCCSMLAFRKCTMKVIWSEVTLSVTTDRGSPNINHSTTTAITSWSSVKRTENLAEKMCHIAVQAHYSISFILARSATSIMPAACLSRSVFSR